MKARVHYFMADNAFIRIDDRGKAQQLADCLSPEVLHRILDRYAKTCCPVLDVFGQIYLGSLMQLECSTELAFRSEATMKAALRRNFARGNCLGQGGVGDERPWQEDDAATGAGIG